MTQQSCLSGEGWPLWRISLTFSLTSTAKRRGTLEQKRPLLRYFYHNLAGHAYVLIVVNNAGFKAVRMSSSLSCWQVCSVVCGMPLQQATDNQSPPQAHCVLWLYVSRTGRYFYTVSMYSCPHFIDLIFRLIWLTWDIDQMMSTTGLVTIWITGQSCTSCSLWCTKPPTKLLLTCKTVSLPL